MDTWTDGVQRIMEPTTRGELHDQQRLNSIALKNILTLLWTAVELLAADGSMIILL